MLLVAAIYVFNKHRERRRLNQALSMVLFLIRIPRGAPSAATAQAEQDRKAEINYSEQLIINLVAMKQPFVLEVAVPHIGEEIHFYLAVPRQYSETAVKQVHGFWSSASVTQVDDDYNIFNPHGVTVAASLKLQRHFALPIRTYQEIGTDTFSSILGAFTKVSEVGEGAALQVVFQPAPKYAKKTVLHIIKELKRGKPLERLTGVGFGKFVGELKETLKSQTEEAKKEEAQKVVDEDAAKAVESKLSKPFFAVNVRLLASAATPFQANDILEGLAAGFGQFSSPRRNEFKLIKPKNPHNLAHAFSYRMYDGGQEMILNSEEIVSFFHLPLSTSDTPRIKWLKSKESPPPDNLPKAGCFIGESSYRGQLKPVYITDEDRGRHVYVIGQTGTGKTTLFKSMIMDDIARGKGVCVVDPHGEFAEFALANVPKDRLEDVIYFDPGDLTRPMGLNMIEYNFDRPEEKTFIVNEMQSIFNKLFSQETMGPMFEQYMRNALLLIMEDMPNEPGTLIEVPRIFTDTAFRKRKLERITNPVVVDFWEKEAIKAGGEASLANMTPYITSKFNNFIANDYMRVIIGQEKSAFNFRDVMDSSKILLVNLSKGKIGDINANLLGMIVVGKLLMAALSRGDSTGSRPDFNLYIDEFQNFTTDSISTILSEARKYKLNLAIAHQFIAQLTEKIRDAVFGNVGNQIILRVGPQDAEFLVKQFDPIFTQTDLVSIDNFNAYVKILANGLTLRPFNIKISKRAWELNAPRELMEKMKEYSRLKYGLDREMVEEGIFRRLRSGEDEDDADDEEEEDEGGANPFASLGAGASALGDKDEPEDNWLDEDEDEKKEKDDAGGDKEIDGEKKVERDEEETEEQKEKEVEAEGEGGEEAQKEEGSLSEIEEGEEEPEADKEKEIIQEETAAKPLPEEAEVVKSKVEEEEAEDEEQEEDKVENEEGSADKEGADITAEPDRTDLSDKSDESFDSAQDKSDKSDEPEAESEPEKEVEEEEKSDESDVSDKSDIPKLEELVEELERPAPAPRVSPHSFGAHVKKRMGEN